MAALPSENPRQSQDCCQCSQPRDEHRAICKYASSQEPKGSEEGTTLTRCQATALNASALEFGEREHTVFVWFLGLSTASATAALLRDAAAATSRTCSRFSPRQNFCRTNGLVTVDARAPLLPSAVLSCLLPRQPAHHPPSGLAAAADAAAAQQSALPAAERPRRLGRGTPLWLRVAGQSGVPQSPGHGPGHVPGSGCRCPAEGRQQALGLGGHASARVEAGQSRRCGEPWEVTAGPAAA